MFVLLNIGLGSWGLTESSEARYTEIGREMLESGDYLYPTLLGIRHFDKPPLTYYITAAGLQLFGVNEFGARFFLSVALIIQIILIFRIAVLLFGDRKIALTAAVIYFSYPLVGISARVLTTDCYLVTLILGSIYFFLRHKIRGSPFGLYVFYVLLGMGFLTKGPAALVPVGLFLVLWKLLKKDRIHISLHTLLAALLSILIGGCWFIAIALDTPGFLDFFFRGQILERAVAANNMHRDKSFFYYLPLIPLIGFPWIPFLISRSFFRKKLDSGYDKTPLILLLSGLGVVLFYSLISSKLILYILPAFPFFALFTAYWVEGMGKKEIQAYTGILGLLCLLLAAFLLLANLIPGLEFHWFPALLLSGAILAATLIILKYLRRPDYFAMLGLSAVYIFGLLLTFPIFAANNPQKVNTLKPIMSFLGKEGLKEDRKLVVYDFWVPSTSFYLRGEVVTIKNGNKRINEETKFEPDESYKETYLDIQNPEDAGRIGRILNGKGHIFLVLKKDSLPDPIKVHLQQYRNRYDFHKYSLYY